MITLEAADLIEGDASAANVVDYIINGVQEASSVVSVKALADGQLPASKGTLYTTPASTTAIVKSVILVNADSSARTVNLYVQRDGSNSRRIIPENLSLEANGGSAILADQLYVFSAAGELLYKANYQAHASNHITGGPDEVDGDKLDIDWNPSNYTPATTPSEADNVDNLTAHLYGIDQELGQKLENIVEDTSPQLGGDLDCQNNKFTNMLGFLMKSSTELTISSGAVTVTQMFHTIDTEGGAATDDLDTINGGTTINMIVIRAEDDARTVVVKHNTGNIWLQGKADINLDDLEDGLLLVYDGTKWFDIAAGGGGGGGGAGTKIEDGDSDTKVDTEESSDEDKIRMDVAGVEAFLLESDGILTLAKQSMARGYKDTATQSIPNQTWTKIRYNGESFDVQGEFVPYVDDPVNEARFTAKDSGKYLVIAATGIWGMSDGKTVYSGLYKNGAQYGIILSQAAGSNAYVQVAFLDLISLSANDYLEGYIFHNQGSAMNIWDSKSVTYLGVAKVA